MTFRASQFAQLMAKLDELQADVVWLKQQWSLPGSSSAARAVITLSDSFEYGEPTLSLTVEEWAIVKRGDKFEKYDEGRYEEGQMSYLAYWEFEGGVGGKITFSTKSAVGDDFEVEIEEKFFAEMVTEFNVAQ
jgi:hypothetical protein